MCRPRPGDDEIPCAKKIISRLARQAYRRPVDDNDLEDLLSFYQTRPQRREFRYRESARRFRRLSRARSLCFGSSGRPPNVAPGTNYRISDLELASRLSYFLWSSAPDDQLISVASQGKLKDPAVLEKQVRRMLADPRSEALTTNFAGQWLHLAESEGRAARTCSFIPISTRLWRIRCGAKPSCCSTASCARTATSWIC